jgi:hypothetical protein
MFRCVPAGAVTHPVRRSAGPPVQPPGRERKQIARIADSVADASVSTAIPGCWTDLPAESDQLLSHSRLPYPSKCVTPDRFRVVGP